MIYTLLRLFEVEELFLTGFTMYQPVAGSTMKYFGEQKLGVGLGHDLDSEEKTFKALIATFTGKLETTPEVARLLAQSTDGPAIRRGFLGAADADARVRWHEHLRAWLSWACIRIGLGLRRGLETNSAFEFSAWQEGRRPRPTRRHKKRQAKSSGKSSTEQ